MDYNKLTVSVPQMSIFTSFKNIHENILYNHIKLQVVKLRTELQKYGLPKYGRKCELIKRLTEMRLYLSEHGVTKEVQILLTRTDVPETSPTQQISERKIPYIEHRRATIRQSHRDKRERRVAISTLQPSLRKFEMVWAQIRGYPLWPGIIENNNFSRPFFFFENSIFY